ncbi:MAG: Holliday junction branch migration protein RuvA, partial [Clostridiales bacterium]|nr:Holliday junction branch migration protein RuvA [Clostridiales bacterium]
MYAHLMGIVAEKTADSVVIDVGGVGYLVSVTAAALSAAPRTGEQMKLY